VSGIPAWEVRTLSEGSRLRILAEACAPVAGVSIELTHARIHPDSVLSVVVGSC
jgi:hypothetical protein